MSLIVKLLDKIFFELILFRFCTVYDSRSSLPNLVSFHPLFVWITLPILLLFWNIRTQTEFRLLSHECLKLLSLCCSHSVHFIGALLNSLITTRFLNLTFFHFYTSIFLLLFSKFSFVLACKYLLRQGLTVYPWLS